MAYESSVLASEKRILVPTAPAGLFFDFAFPAYGKCQGHNPQEKARLGRMYLAGESPSMQELAELFPVGVLSLRYFAGNPYMSLEDITLQHVADYVLHGHNQMIDSGKMRVHRFSQRGDRDFCRVRQARVFQKVVPAPQLMVKYDDSDIVKFVKSHRTPDASSGDYVHTHRGYTLIIPDIS
ncbi:hypothetical protein GF386_03660 [Candidatus Pacearchaeota archaeon]|nr:hypothetical protein [Candidatus Pacearchaeota archaeon]MBD3283248.1 hypothetical protein [Candidatus Pacearchaeota archaeon]